MVVLTMLSPGFLTAAFEWAGAVVTVLAVGRGSPAQDQAAGERR